MTKITTKERVHAIILDLAIDLKPIVRDIENSPETTQGHYGDYMAALSEAGSKANRHIVATALIVAGANVIGMKGAMQAHGIPLTGIEKWVGLEV